MSFDYDLIEDSPHKVAIEMQRDLLMDEDETFRVQYQINEVVKKVIDSLNSRNNRSPS